MTYTICRHDAYNLRRAFPHPPANLCAKIRKKQKTLQLQKNYLSLHPLNGNKV